MGKRRHLLLLAATLLLAILVLPSTLPALLVGSPRVVATVKVGKMPWDAAYDPAKNEVFVVSGAFVGPPFAPGTVSVI